MNETKKLYWLDHGALAGVCAAAWPSTNVIANLVRLIWVALCFARAPQGCGSRGGGLAVAQEEPGLPRLVRTTENMVRRPPGRPPCFCYRYSEEALT